MSYTPPINNAVDFSWQSAPLYSPPAGGSIDSSWLVSLPPRTYTGLLHLRFGLGGTLRLAPRPDIIYTGALRLRFRLFGGKLAPGPQRRVSVGTAIRPTTPIHHGCVSAWGLAGAVQHSLAAPWPQPQWKQHRPALVWGASAAIDQRLSAAWRRPHTVQDSTGLPWGAPSPSRRATCFVWSAPTTRQHVVAGPWGRPTGRHLGTAIDFDSSLLRHLGVHLLWGKPAIADAPRILPWWRPRIAYPFFVPSEPPIPVPPDPLAGATFAPFIFADFYTFNRNDPAAPNNDGAALNVDFRFRPSRLIRVEHTASLVKWPSLTPLPVSGARLTLNRGDLAWSATLQISDRNAAESVAPQLNGVQEVLLTLDGYAWRLVVEGYEESKRFGESTYSLTARSPAAYLAAPYAETRSQTASEPKTAHQLADIEVEELGFTIDWNVIDWLIPAGAWSYAGKTRIDAIATLAAAVGGIVVPSRTEKAIAIEYRHQVPSWGWSSAVPDRILNTSMLERLGSRFEPATQHNKAYVFGGAAGGQGAGVTREGTGGDKPAETIIDPLITDALAGQERGRQVLSQSGNRLIVSMEMALTPANQNPGLLEPGAIVWMSADGWKGHVTATSISADWKDGLTIRQAVTVERAA